MLFNPRSGGARGIDAIRAALAARFRVTLVAATSPDDLRRRAAEVARGSWSCIVLAGGDGTVHAAINGMAERFPRAPVAVLPLGTGNDLCRALAIPLDPIAATDLIGAGRTHRIDLVRVEGDFRGIMVNAAVGGVGAQVSAEVTHAVKEFWGSLAYLRGAAGALGRPPVHRLELRLDRGVPRTLEAHNVVVANGRTAAGGVDVAPRSDLEDGLVDVVVIRAGGDALDLSVIAARVLAGDYTSEQHVLHARARRVELVLEAPVPFSLDGEPCQARRLAFSVLPRRLRVVTGPGYGRSSFTAADDTGEVAIAYERPSIGRRTFGVVAGLLLVARQLPRPSQALLLGAAVLIVAFAWLAHGVQLGQWVAFDQAARGQLAAASDPRVRAVAASVTTLGGVVGATAVAAGSVAWLAWRRRYLDAATLVAVVLGCAAMELVMKPLFAVVRPRPIDPSIPWGAFAFPSGHALRAFGLYGCLAALVVSGNPRVLWRWAVAALLVSVAGLVAWSRVCLDVHWTSDAIGGALASTTWVVVCMVARRYAKDRNRAQAERGTPQ